MKNDLPIFFSENNYQSETQLLSFIGIETKEESFLYLLENGYLKKNRDSKLAFDYVGLIVLKQKLLCVFPKYYNQTDLDTYSNYENYFTDFIQILKVLKKKAQTINEQGQYNFIATEKQANELVIAEEIIKDYISHGIYLKDRTEYSLNSEGETNWDATVSILQPFFSKRNVIYPDVYSSNTLIEEDYVITQIHKWAVKFCIKKYSRLLDYKIVFEEDSVNDYLEIGDKEFLNSILSKELNSVFVDRNIRLLKLLRSLIAENYNQKNRGIILYGTNTFHVIWEETCSVSFNNLRNNKIKDVIENLTDADMLNFKSKAGKDMDFMDIIPKPEWYELSSKKSKKVKNTLIPDIISVITNSCTFNDLFGTQNLEQKVFFVLDPKYYNLEMDYNNSKDSIDVKNNPGVADITKQILYEHVYQDQLSTYFNKWYNILLFPKLLDEFNQSTSRFYKIIGNVKFELSIFNGHLVWLVGLNPRDIFDSYLNNCHDGESKLKELSNEIDNAKYYFMQSKTNL